MGSFLRQWPQAATWRLVERPHFMAGWIVIGKAQKNLDKCSTRGIKLPTRCKALHLAGFKTALTQHEVLDDDNVMILFY